tara:strand:- start:1492 stop:1758 length:267 start_codon:yes stop_codon:yes gene_type:complete
MLFEITTIVLIIFSVFMSYMMMLCLRRVNQYENFILKIQQIIEIATQRLTAVDARGHYESDDETAFFFQQLKDIQEILDSLFESETKE